MAAAGEALIVQQIQFYLPSDGLQRGEFVSTWSAKICLYSAKTCAISRSTYTHTKQGRLMLQRTTNSLLSSTRSLQAFNSGRVRISHLLIHLHHVSGCSVPSRKHRRLHLSKIRLRLALYPLDWPSAELLGVLDRRELLRVQLPQEEVGCSWIGERVRGLVDDCRRKVGCWVGGGESGEVSRGAEGVGVGGGRGGL